MIEQFWEWLGSHLYKVLQKSSVSVVFFPKSVQKDIDILGESTERYYIKKLGYVCGLCVAGIGIFLVYGFSSCFHNGVYVEYVQRPQVYEKSEEISLKTGKQNDIITVEVEPVLWTKQEADAGMEQVISELEYEILGANQSLEEVEADLYLMESLEGYPFDIYWKSSDETLIDTYGTVNRTGLLEDTIVTLTVEFTYMDWEWSSSFAVVLKKEVLTEQEQYKRSLETLLLQEQAENRQETEWELPKYMGEERLYYQETEKDNTVLILAVLVLVGAVGVWIGQDKDLHKNRMTRQQQFKTEYIYFAESLSLYISAGLTLPTAMQFCINDYKKRKPKEHLLREALLDFQKDMQNGIGFLEAMKRLSETSDDVNYKRLAGLLNQGMINGALGLADSLEQEVQKTREEKRRQSKVEGEKVSTALIAPMMLQLGIVIVLIMLPAFSSMQL